MTTVLEIVTPPYPKRRTHSGNRCQLCDFVHPVSMNKRSQAKQVPSLFRYSQNAVSSVRKLQAREGTLKRLNTTTLCSVSGPRRNRENISRYGDGCLRTQKWTGESYHLDTSPPLKRVRNSVFLPGDIADKVHPYLRPLYDALYDMMPPETLDKYIERNVIEVAPIAFMRGRTLNNSFVVLDEATKRYD